MRHSRLRRVTLFLLLYIIPLTIRLYIYNLTNFLFFLKYFNFVYLSEQVIDAFASSYENKSIQHYFLVSQTWQQAIYKVIILKLLFQHRYKSWSSE